MGLSIFSRGRGLAGTPHPVDPDPLRWEFIEVAQYAKGYALKVRYPNCTTFRGVKVLVYFGEFDKATTERDPHFRSTADAPVGRFTPTDWGWNQACKMAQGLCTGTDHLNSNL